MPYENSRRKSFSRNLEHTKFQNLESRIQRSPKLKVTMIQRKEASLLLLLLSLLLLAFAFAGLKLAAMIYIYNDLFP